MTLKLFFAKNPHKTVLIQSLRRHLPYNQSCVQCRGTTFWRQKSMRLRLFGRRRTTAKTFHWQHRSPSGKIRTLRPNKENIQLNKKNNITKTPCINQCIANNVKG